MSASQDQDLANVRVGLERYSKEELIELVHYLTRAYVVEGTIPFKAETAPVNIPRSLRELDFPGLIGQLKIQLGLPELELFQISEGQVTVMLGGRDYVVSPNAVVDVAPTRSEPAQAAPGTTSERPAASAPAPAAKAPVPVPEPAPADGGGTADRFKMLDLD